MSADPSETAAADALRERSAGFAQPGEGLTWLEAKWARVEQLAGDGPIQRYVFGPFAALIRPASDGKDDTVRAVITQVALINALLAGLPGQLGVGVFVCQGFELWMAWRIACRVGLKAERPRDLLPYLGVASGVLVTVVAGMRLLLHLLYPLFFYFPAPMVPVELLATDIVGVVFWTGFGEAAQHGAFGCPRRLFGSMKKEVRGLFRFQCRKVRDLATRENLNGFVVRFRELLGGEIVAPTPPIRDDALVALGMAALLQRRIEVLAGPLGQAFLNAIRDVLPDLEGTSAEEVADNLVTCGDEAIQAMLGNIRSRLMEFVEHGELDGASVRPAAVVSDSSPTASADLVLCNTAANRLSTIELHKASASLSLEHALANYPPDQVCTASKLRRALDGAADGTPPTDFLRPVTAESFDAALEALDTSTDEPSRQNVARKLVATTMAMWPFAMAYSHGRITGDQLLAAATKLYEQDGKALVVRLCAAAVGPAVAPIYGWFALAQWTRGVARAVGIED